MFKILLILLLSVILLKETYKDQEAFHDCRGKVPAYITHPPYKCDNQYKKKKTDPRCSHRSEKTQPQYFCPISKGVTDNIWNIHPTIFHNSSSPRYYGGISC